MRDDSIAAESCKMKRKRRLEGKQSLWGFPSLRPSTSARRPLPLRSAAAPAAAPHTLTCSPRGMLLRSLRSE